MLASAAAGVSGIVACHDVTAPVAVPSTRVQPQWVTGEAAAALDTVTGLITLSKPPGRYVSLLAADSLLYALPIELGTDRVVSASLVDWSNAVGAVNWHLCGSPTYATSPFGEFPPTVPAVLQRTLRSQWAIPICGNVGIDAASVGVSDSPREYVVVDDVVQLATPNSLDGALSMTDLPARYPTGLPVTPEEAIEAVFQATGRRIATTPVPFDELGQNGSSQLSPCASWRMSVEAPVTVKSQRTGAVWTTSELFVHHAPACFSDSTAVDAAEPDQPTSKWVTVSTAGDSVAVPLIGPVHFDPVTIVP